MKLTRETQDELYRIIHEEVGRARTLLRLLSFDDQVLTDVENAVWARICRLLKLLKSS